MRIIGIDPGASGGMACFTADANGPDVFKFDGATERDIVDKLREWEDDSDEWGQGVACYIERLGAMPRDEQGRAKQSPTTMFKMGLSYGFLRGALLSLHIPFEEILAAHWQRTFGLKGPSGESRTDKKNRHKAKAQQLWPQVKVTHAIADALLIAEFGRRQWSLHLRIDRSEKRPR